MMRNQRRQLSEQLFPPTSGETDTLKEHVPESGHPFPLFVRWNLWKSCSRVGKGRCPQIWWG